MLDSITLGVVTARGEATITYNNRPWCSYTRKELAIEYWALDSPTRRGWKTWESKCTPFFRKWARARRAESKPGI